VVLEGSLVLLLLLEGVSVGHPVMLLLLVLLLLLMQLLLRWIPLYQVLQHVLLLLLLLLWLLLTEMAAVASNKGTAAAVAVTVTGLVSPACRNSKTSSNVWMIIQKQLLQQKE
jgi:hypothetical protein